MDKSKHWDLIDHSLNELRYEYGIRLMQVEEAVDERKHDAVEECVQKVSELVNGITSHLENISKACALIRKEEDDQDAVYLWSKAFLLYSSVISDRPLFNDLKMAILDCSAVDVYRISLDLLCGDYPASKDFKLVMTKINEVAVDLLCLSKERRSCH